MMAAITAAQRGHEVILCEASDSLGGALKFAQYIDFKRDLYGVSQALAAKLLRTSVRVCMKTEVTPALVEELKPDVVIVAVGAEPVVPPIEGVHGEHVYLASEAEQLDVRRMGESIVVLGGGLVGCETAIHLAKQGKKVTIVEMCSRVAPDCNCFHKTALDMQLNDLVTVLTETRAVEITAEGLLVRDYMENEMQIKADTVILAAGMRSNTVLAEQLQQMDVEVQVIGDAVRPNKVTQAIHDGYYCAKYL